MSSATEASLAIDEARQMLSREFARCLNAGKHTIRVRIVKSTDSPVEAWFYVHSSDGWQKEPHPVTNGALVGALDETLEMLASQEHHDEWAVRRHAHSDGLDTDFQFHLGKLQDHLGERLELALAGLLFRDRHDSKKDMRRSIRTPRPGQPRR